jgi:hypothetical protein
MRADLLQSWLPPKPAIRVIVVPAYNYSSLYPCFSRYRLDIKTVLQIPLLLTNSLIDLLCK